METDFDAKTYSSRRPRTGRSQPEQIARGLGWFSVGVGVAQILAPKVVTRLVGLPVPRALTVACGVRELICGIGILSQREPLPWLNARIAGDALDIAALGGMMMLPGAQRGRAAAAAAVTAGVTALDLYCSRELGRQERRPPPRHDRINVDVNRSAPELYRFCRTLDNLAPVLPNLESVRVLDGLRSHWISRGPQRVEWDCEIIDDVPGERVVWRAVEGSAVNSAGSVQLSSLPGGTTRVSLELVHEPPRPSLSSALAQLFGMGWGQRPAADAQALRRILER